MSILSVSSSLSSSLSLKILSIPYNANPRPYVYSLSRLFKKTNRFAAMSSAADFSGRPGPSSSSAAAEVHEVPAIATDQVDRVADQAFQRYFSESAKRSGNGVAIVWFRNDLRVLDNEALFKAWVSSEEVLPVYCIDPRIFGTTYYFGFPKTGALRAQFLIECLFDLRKNLQKRGLNLLLQQGKPEKVIPSLAKTFGAHTVYAQKETCSEELRVERLVAKGLQKVVVQSSSDESDRSDYPKNPKLQLVWGSTMYHIDDLPFEPIRLPDVYTQFRKAVEAKCTVRSCIKIPTSLGQPPIIADWGSVPSIDQLGLGSQSVGKGVKFVGGESAALSRVYDYFWKKDYLRKYKETRNGMLGPDYSTKFSPWLASGSLSPCLIHEEVKRYEKERVANDSTYWVLFELIWRHYFRFLSIKYGNSIFHIGGPRKVQQRYPLIDANMKELSTTGFMSNRGRQIVCSFLVRDMGLDWRMGAEWFETCLLDYDPCSNYGNWTYGAGVGNDPREDRYFSIPKQAQTYDPEGEYVAYWLPQLQSLPKEKRHFPGKSYIDQVVPLKHGGPTKFQNRDTAFSTRKNNFRPRQSGGQRR